MKWLVVVVVLVMYVHMFNGMATWYLDSDRTLTWNDAWKKIAPPVKLTIELT